MRRGDAEAGLAARLEAMEAAFVDALMETIARLAIGALREGARERRDAEHPRARWKNRTRPRELIARDVERIAQLLRLERRPLRADEIREKLGISQRALALPLRKGVAAGRWSKEGARAMTVYRAR